MLHDNRELFEQVILKTSDEFGIEAGIIEKDYYVTEFLRAIVKKQPDIIFKGGTSLSKCYKIINRFSEDIDLNLKCDKKPSEGQRRKLKSNILSAVDELKMELSNPENIRSRRDFNKYIIDYPIIAGTNYLKSQLVIETAVFFRSYPTVPLMASSFIYDYLSKNGLNDFAEKYALGEFEVNVQSAERTFIDKVYALGDYYLSGEITEHSRHIYDLYKLSGIVTIDNTLKELAKQVAEERKSHKTCLSVQDGINIRKLLKEIINKSIYKNDYENITSALLFEKVEYSTAIKALQKIADSDLFE